MTKEIISTRPAVADDAPAIAAMQRSLADYCGYPRFFSVSEKRIRNAIADEESHDKYFVADDMFADGHRDEVEWFRETAGFVHIGRAPLALNGVRGFYVDDLYVRPELLQEYRIGVSLLARAAEAAIEFADGNPDMAFLRIDTANRNNDPTLREYDGVGFDQYNTNLRLRGDVLKELASRAMTTPAPGFSLTLI